MNSSIQFILILLVAGLFAASVSLADSASDELTRIQLDLFGGGNGESPPPSVTLTPEETLERVKRARALLLERSGGDSGEFGLLKDNIEVLFEAATIDDQKCSEESLDQRQKSLAEHTNESANVAAYLKKQAQLQLAYCAENWPLDKKLEFTVVPIDKNLEYMVLPLDKKLEYTVVDQLDPLVKAIDGAEAATVLSRGGNYNVPVPSDELTMAKGILAYLIPSMGWSGKHQLDKALFGRHFSESIAEHCKPVNKALGSRNSPLEKFLGSDLLDLVANKKILYWIRVNRICWKAFEAKNLAFIIAATKSDETSEATCRAESLAEVYYIFRDNIRSAIKTNPTLSGPVKLNLSRCAHRITKAAAMMDVHERKKFADFANMVNRALGAAVGHHNGERALAKSLIRKMKAEGFICRFSFRQLDKEKFLAEYSVMVQKACKHIVGKLEQPATLFLSALQTDEELLSQVNSEAKDLVKGLEACNKVKSFSEDAWNFYRGGKA